ncbi:tRNA (adenosine(37)-N6)-threonylcarbamoyltransferase complex ATPase subunit type 1 TsaE [Ferrimicrobium sp.]|uniref:tRNA (adenosine(37)-N6)-threonylcarbamoyltransferase complex ATPase subunit type 1 TsaE n=1 Tax=Ferrimicrobium sp. TaxID=2926050 RepID=UPI00260AB6F9|nr:tRNA (adenosine(37)-N6)-threonylcarbamoyltransferase complex ATPase subunit type 1 TsaE [Ferrimicrobium sp.]
MRCELTTSQEMFDLGRRFGAALVAGDLILMTGELGAGKTTFTQGVADGLGIMRPLTSPTFVTVKSYALSRGGEFYHVDLYRVHDPDYLQDQGILEELDRGAIAVVEWAEHGRPLDEYERLAITISVEPGWRTMEFEGTPDWQERLRWLL